MEYINVKEHPEAIENMVKFSGDRQVPVIVEVTDDGAKVTSGFGGT